MTVILLFGYKYRNIDDYFSGNCLLEWFEFDLPIDMMYAYVQSIGWSCLLKSLDSWCLPYSDEDGSWV